ncbi:MAG TPA: ADP-glyceromanno-heptose 6-epimerase [Cytophagales bacterium]|nr:ADP-glyceromanno-heptose 6-epimerase [Cytophagales bacterium]HAA21823.1 ADP-glyceromanno-heptose 6-epimerase [Cytophagales bacterium]HAP62953.1 ADP-glyceromanno-heptose 6-epimerase [Cytophagales bacterium]
MNILITGGAGYLGTELSGRLIGLPEVNEVRIYDNLSRKQHDFFLGHRKEGFEKIKFIQGDLLDSRKLKKALDGVDIVYHLAAFVTTPFANADPHTYEQVNHWGTAELTYALEQAQQVKRVIYASSTSVFGAQKAPVTEATVPNPRTFYGISKMRGEEHIRRLGDSKTTYILRFGNVYGYNRSLRFDAVINRFMFDAHFTGRLSIHGDGQQHRAFLPIDLAGKVMTELAHSDAPSGSYNVIDQNRMVLDLVDVFKELYPELEFIFINQHLSLRELKVDPQSALRQYIDYSNPHSLKEELEVFRGKFSF